jgi:selenocysteine lyase/cysteine desulfurase
MLSDEDARRLQEALQAGREPELPGAVRASIGLGTTVQDVDELVAALSACQTR